MIQLTHESFKEIAYLIRIIKQNFFGYDLKCASIASFHKYNMKSAAIYREKKSRQLFTHNDVRESDPEIKQLIIKYLLELYRKFVPLV